MNKYDCDRKGNLLKTTSSIDNIVISLNTNLSKLQLSIYDPQLGQESFSEAEKILHATFKDPSNQEGLIGIFIKSKEVDRSFIDSKFNYGSSEESKSIYLRSWLIKDAKYFLIPETKAKLKLIGVI